MAAWISGVTKEELHEMGRKGLKTIRENYTKEKVTRMYGDLVHELIDKEK